MKQKINRSIVLKNEDHEYIESIVKGFADKYGIDGVDSVQIKLTGESGIVRFRNAEGTQYESTSAINILHEALIECANGALLLNDYLTLQDDPEIAQLRDTIRYVIKSRKDDFL